jgi:surfactin synthase thioesterase subunit
LRVQTPRPNASLRLICLHHAGGGALAFRAWGANLGPDIELAAVQLPGRETRFAEPPLDCVDDVLDGVIAALRGDTRPYALFGHSLGAGLAYRLARRVRQTAELPSPQHLIVSAAQPPAWRLRRRRTDARREPALSDDDLRAELVRLGGTPAALLEDPALLAPFLPALRADFLLARRLVLDEPEAVDVPLMVFGGAQDATVTEDELSGWRHMSNHPISLRMFQGGHFYLQPQMRCVVDAISDALAPLLNPPETYRIEGVVA